MIYISSLYHVVVVVDPTPPTCCQQSPAPESCGSQQSLPQVARKGSTLSGFVQRSRLESSRCIISINISPTSKMFRATDVVRGLRTSRSLQPQKTVPSSLPRNHQPVFQLPEPYQIVFNPLKALETLELWKAKTDLPGNLQPGQLT